MDDSINFAREKEYVETILGRRRYLRDINSRNMATRQFAERNAINAPIQGSAADIIKIAMINIHHWLQREKLRSEEHTSELQSLTNLVCRLLLEKKKDTHHP